MKWFDGKYRKYLSCTQQINSKYNELLNNKNVLIIDDAITSDKTISDMITTAYLHGVNKIYACTIFTHKL